MNGRITIDPQVCHGKPVIKGTRVLVSNILSSLASGESFDDLLEDYPNITREDILAALEFAGELAQFESMSLEMAEA